MEHDEYKKALAEMARIKAQQIGIGVAGRAPTDWLSPDTTNPYQNTAWRQISNPPSAPPTQDMILSDIEFRLTRLTHEVHMLVQVISKMAPQVALIAEVFDAMHLKEEDDNK